MFGMRSQPWHEPRPTLTHYQWFKNLLDLHRVTRAWVRDLKVETAPAPELTYQLTRVMGPDLRVNLDQIQGLSETATEADLDLLLDHTTPTELLQKLEITVWAVHAWTFKDILEKTPKNEREAMLNLLEQSCWKSGRECANRRWPSFPDASKGDLRDIAAAFDDTPFSGYPDTSNFLVRRALKDHVELELIHWGESHPQVASLADIVDLGILHIHWLKGYAYSLNTQVMLEIIEPGHGSNQRGILRLSFLV